MLRMSVGELRHSQPYTDGISSNQFVLKYLPAKISPLPEFLCLPGFGKIANLRLAKTTISLISHKALKSQTWEACLQFCHVGIVLHPNLYGRNCNISEHYLYCNCEQAAQHDECLENICYDYTLHTTLQHGKYSLQDRNTLFQKKNNISS